MTAMYPVSKNEVVARRNLIKMSQACHEQQTAQGALAGYLTHQRGEYSPLKCSIKQPTNLFSSTSVMYQQIKHCLKMEPFEIFHTKSIYTEEGKCSCNSWPAVCNEMLGRRENCLPFHFIMERIGINQRHLTTLPTGLQQHPQKHFISLSISEKQTVANF